ncbi:MAG: PAS domain S-box protein [Chitinophagaceae bacterium]|nr:MAG: PAS domain S-box protein [Chitinophagaceae bacterium]
MTSKPYDYVFKLTPFPTVLLHIKEGIARIADVNLAYLDLFGTKHEHIVGKEFMGFIDDESENPIFRQYGSAIQASIGRVVRFNQTKAVRLDHIKLEILNTPIFDDNGKLDYIIHVLKPLDTQKNTEKLLSLIVNNTEEAFILVDRELIITSFNDKFSELYLAYFGVQVIAGDSILDYAMPNRRKRLRNIYNNVLKGNIEYSEVNVEHEHVNRKVSLKYNPIYQEDKKVIGVFITASDVTDLSNFEVQLKTREEELSLIFDNLTEIVFLINVEDNNRFRFKSVNKAFVSASGLSLDQLLGNYVEDVIPEPLLGLVLSKYREAIAKKTVVTWEQTTVHAAGKKAGIVSVNPVFDSNGNCIELVGSVYDITDRVASEQRFKNLVQEGSDMIGILDAKGNYLYVSPTSMVVLGRTSDEFIGKNTMNFIHPDDRESVFANFGKLGVEKRISIKPFRYQHKNGTWRWIETIATDLLDEPSINGIVTNSRDVTDKIVAQKEMLLNNERYKYVTKATNWVDEYWYLRSDGNYAYVQDRGFVIRDEQNKAIRMVGAMQDISQRKKEEQQLKLLESVITNTTDSILITEAEPFDEPGPRILYVNEAFTKLTGYTAEEVIGKTPRLFQGPKTDRATLDFLKSSLKKFQACNVDLVNYKKNGEEFWINLSITPVADERGWFTHWISIERDITESRNLEIQKVLLADISKMFNTSQSLTETLSTVLQTICNVGNYCAAEIWLVDERKQELNLLTKHSVDKKMEQFYEETRDRRKFKFGEGLPGMVWELQSPQSWKVETGHAYSFKKAAKKAQLTKGIGVPLFNIDKVNGVLMLGTRDLEQISSSAVISADFGTHLGAEIKRKQLDQELNQLFIFAPDVISISNFDGFFTKVNPAACNLLGYTSEELLSQPITNFIHPNDRERSDALLHTQKNGSETYYFENRYITKSGRVKWLGWTSNTIVEEGLVFSVAKDITDKRNLEGMLLKSNNLGKVGSWEIDVIGGTVYWSDITKEIRETEPGFVPTLETGIHYFKEGRDKETITQKVNECKLHGTPWDDELQILTFKGNLKWIRTIGQAEMVNGKCIRIYGSFQDIDERKKNELRVRQAAEELEESEKRYSDLFHLSPLPKWVYDVETLQFLDVNQAAIKHYGYTYEDFLGMTIKDIRPGEEETKLNEAIAESNRHAKPFFEGVFLHQNKDKELLNVEIKSSRIMFKGRRAKVVVSNDITERLKYVYAIEQQNKKLQEISWIQSHVVRAPLSRLMGLIYLLKNKAAQLDLSEEEIIHHIEHSAEELDEKIKEIIKKSDQKEI